MSAFLLASLVAWALLGLVAAARVQAATRPSSKQACLISAQLYRTDARSDPSPVALLEDLVRVRDKKLVKLIRTVMQDDSDQQSLDAVARWCRSRFSRVRAIRTAEFTARSSNPFAAITTVPGEVAFLKALAAENLFGDQTVTSNLPLYHRNRAVLFCEGAVNGRPATSTSPARSAADIVYSGMHATLLSGAPDTKQIRINELAIRNVCPSAAPLIEPARTATTTTAPAPTTRANSPCMSLEEFNQIEAGMTYDQVVAIVGSSGSVLSESNVAGYRTVMYMWSGCGSTGANANVMFQNGGQISKAQFGLR